VLLDYGGKILGEIYNLVENLRPAPLIW